MNNAVDIMNNRDLAVWAFNNKSMLLYVARRSFVSLSDTDMEDVFSDTLLKILASDKPYDENLSKPVTIVVNMLKNRIVDLLRTTRTHLPGDVLNTVSVSPDVLKEIDHGYYKVMLQSLIAHSRLSEINNAIILCLLDGLNYKEIAKNVHLTEDSIKSHVFNIRKDFRKAAHRLGYTEIRKRQKAVVKSLYEKRKWTEKEESYIISCLSENMTMKQYREIGLILDRTMNSIATRYRYLKNKQNG